MLEDTKPLERTKDTLQEEGVIMDSTLEKYNVRDTKRFYSDINEKALKGLPVNTINMTRKNKMNMSEVTHIKTELLQIICTSPIIYEAKKKYNAELDKWVISVKEIGLYGSGKTENEAVEDFIDAIIEFTEVYKDKINIITLMADSLKQAYMAKILLCDNDRSKLKSVIGL